MTFEKYSRHGPFVVGGGVVDAGRTTISPPTERQEVVRPAGFGRRAEGRPLPPTKGLSADDGAGDMAIDVEVARFDLVDPSALLGRIEGMEPRRQSVSTAFWQ